MIKLITGNQIELKILILVFTSYFLLNIVFVANSKISIILIISILIWSIIYNYFTERGSKSD